MALEAGGYAEKLGNRYEANWIAYQLLRLLEEKLTWVIVEPIGEDEVGVDVVVGLPNNISQHHQCKVGSGNSEYWTIPQLNQSKILSNAKYQIDRGNTEFHLVSPLACKVITDLGESALNSNGVAQDFVKHQVKTSQERIKAFNSICTYLALDENDDIDILKAIQFLKRFKITPYIINQYTKNELEDKASNLFSGEPIKLINFLKNYAVEYNKLRRKITLQELDLDLKSSGFNPKLIPDDSRISPVIERLSTDFQESIKPFLISNQLIPRTELNEITDSVHQNAVTLIKAEAGMGKSALLLELHETLGSQNIISVPVRLDRKRPENNADAFGVSLGFPYSPVLSLSKFANSKKIVVILDQLDAIRWTASHSNNALQVCQELVRQVLSLRKEGVDINIVMASRNFDISEDVALSSWINSLDNELKEIYVSNLDETVVESLISPFEKYKTLAEEKKKILQIPLWLSIYLTIAQRTQSAPQFNNKLELVKSYWEDRISLISTFGITEQDSRRLIDEVVVLMTSKSRLSISENTLTIGSKNTLQALLSIGLLAKQNQRISFRHQALFDYQVGIKLFNAGVSSPSTLLDEIGDFNNQTLTKREHLKYALNMLLDSEQREFCLCATAILQSKSIRFHLKYLTLNIIKEITTLTKPAKVMIDEIIAQPDLQSKFLSNSCYRNHNIIQYLSVNGTLSRWLNGEDNELMNTTLKLLSSIAESAPELVITELKPFVGVSELWNNRVYKGLCWNIEEDPDEIFSLRVELLSLGCNADFINWKAIAKNKPERVLTLIELMLVHYKDVLCIPRYSPEAKKLEKFARRDNWSSSELEGINNLTKEIPEITLCRLLKIINSFVDELDDENITYQWLYKDKYSNYDSVNSLTNGVFSIIELSGEQLSSNPELLMELIKPYLISSNPVLIHLVAKLLLNLSLEYSDTVIGWLLNAPKPKFICGNTYIEPKWILPGKLIEKFSSNCSEALFKALEKEIYYFASTKDIDKIKWRLEHRRQGWYYSYWGETQYFLLPKLSKNRVSNKSNELIHVLNRKFSTYSEKDFCSAHNHSGGMVTSPLPLGNLLSDKSWKKIILTPEDQVNTRNWKQIGEKTITEVSVEQFSRSLDSAVRNEPIRFANLALSLPVNIHKNYIESFFSGLSEKDSNRVSESYRDKWHLCSVELTEKVINHFNSDNYEHSLVRLLESRIAENGWSDKAKELLSEIAKNAKDPSFDKLNIRNIKKSDSAAEADIETLRSNAINCVRGIAYRGVSRIFWEDKEYALKNKHVIDDAIGDLHPAVNFTTVDLLLPMSNYANDYAHKKFLELCNKDLRMVCGYEAHHFFNQGFEDENKHQYVELVLRMLNSSFKDVRKEAARQVYARWFFSDLFENEVSLIVNGDSGLMEGCASVVQQFLGEDKYHEKIHKIESAYNALVNCENEDILRMVGGCVSDDSFWTKHNSNLLFEIFVKSKAAKHCLWDLFYKLENHSGSIADFGNHLLELITNLINDSADDKSNQQMSIRESSIITVLQRLYDEASEDEDKAAINTCLDIWDKLLQSEIYSAINAVNELDKGLLN
ncbi:hypothetical protein [Colwellia sp. E150_009]